MDREIRPLLQRFRAKAVQSPGSFPTWRFQVCGNWVTAIRSGIGAFRAAAATRQAAELSPAVIISAGFCGAISDGAATGEVFMAEKIRRYSSGSLSDEFSPAGRLVDRLGNGLRKGIFITTDEIIEKARIRRLLLDPAAINMLEMESAAVAEVCSASGIDFAAIRSVSDRADRDPAGIFRLISDKDHNISMTKVALAIAKKPSLIRELLALSRDTSTAATALANALELALERIR